MLFGIQVGRTQRLIGTAAFLDCCNGSGGRWNCACDLNTLVGSFPASCVLNSANLTMHWCTHCFSIGYSWHVILRWPAIFVLEVGHRIAVGLLMAYGLGA